MPPTQNCKGELTEKRDSKIPTQNCEEELREKRDSERERGRE